MNQLQEATTKAAQAAEMLVSDIRAAHKATCAAGGPLELLTREAIHDAVRLAQRLHEIAGFAAPSPVAAEPIDDDTGRPIVRPVYIIKSANAYWTEPVSARNPIACLMTAPLDAQTMAVLWDQAYEVDPHECADFDSIIGAMS